MRTDGGRLVRCGVKVREGCEEAVGKIRMEKELRITIYFL
jgi:hypothetical protein